MPEKNILVVEANEMLGGLYAAQLARLGNGEYSSTVVTSAASAREAFHATPDVVAIITAGALQGGIREACGLVREFRAADFKGPVIANSSDDMMNVELLKAGASHVTLGKSQAVAYCLDLLNAVGARR
ncbi:MAG: response regulator transcription factor [Candidatus Liptonbacteria bacterium]|nr:response regulator transcription factor [Candidatus Liptonbacteria bacterium]